MAVSQSGDLIKLAVMAVGGQGGGVLTNWIIDLAKRNGYLAQATSVAGVAQRTGATIYYIEMAPRSDRNPVFSLMPVAGDVDVLIASEIMEAGRAILRGFVTPERTTLIMSSHRILSVAEKTHAGDGIARSEKIIAAADRNARRLIGFDMEQMAKEAGTVISASLFGALAGARVLPFHQDSFIEIIRASNRGVEQSLAAFSAAESRALSGAGVDTNRDDKVEVQSTRRSAVEPLPEALRAVFDRVSQLPDTVQDIASHGLRKVIDFQDVDYGEEYLNRLDTVLEVDQNACGHALTAAAAKHLANAMAYDDVIRVADRKTRGTRFLRVRDELGLEQQQILRLTEFMHPRAEELCSMLPNRLGGYLESSPRLLGIVDRVVNRGRRLRSDTLCGFIPLYVIAGLRRYRRRLHRHTVEQLHLETWLDTVLAEAPSRYELAVELLNHRRLIKGYSDTHARGLAKFDKVMAVTLQISGSNDAAAVAVELRAAALADEAGQALQNLVESLQPLQPA